MVNFSFLHGLLSFHGKHKCMSLNIIIYVRKQNTPGALVKLSCDLWHVSKHSNSKGSHPFIFHKITFILVYYKLLNPPPSCFDNDTLCGCDIYKTSALRLQSYISDEEPWSQWHPPLVQHGCISYHNTVYIQITYFKIMYKVHTRYW